MTNITREVAMSEALQEVLLFQSAPLGPTIHDFGRWRRALSGHTVTPAPAIPLTAPVTDKEIDDVFGVLGLIYDPAAKSDMHGVLTAFAAGRAAVIEHVVVLEGWQLVPEEPTPEMILALQAALERIDSDTAIYRTMLEAAPKPAAKPVVVEPTLTDAYATGQTGAPHNEAEHALFREYLRGHCWLDGMWSDEKKEYIDRSTRMLYAVWRARAALKPAATKGATQ